MMSVGLVGGGHLKFTFMPKIEGDNVIVNARLPLGSPIEETQKIQDQLLSSLKKILNQNGGEDSISLGILSLTGSTLRSSGPRPGQASSGSHVADISVRLVSMDQRNVGTAEVARQWKEANQDLVGLRSLTFGSSLATVGGSPIDIVLSHRDPRQLELASFSSKISRL
jgi:multidrug efflux pump subunit AcrB